MSSATELPTRIELSGPGPFLQVASAPAGSSVHFSESTLVPVFALVALASRARAESPQRIALALSQSQASRFARALGLPEVVSGQSTPDWGEPMRTVRLRRVREKSEIHPVAARVADLMSPDDSNASDTLNYVIVELLRNILQC